MAHHPTWLDDVDWREGHVASKLERTYNRMTNEERLTVNTYGAGKNSHDFVHWMLNDDNSVTEWRLMAVSVERWRQLTTDAEYAPEIKPDPRKERLASMFAPYYRVWGYKVRAEYKGGEHGNPWAEIVVELVGQDAYDPRNTVTVREDCEEHVAVSRYHYTLLDVQSPITEHDHD